jgi:hypothetical protein
MLMTTVPRVVRCTAREQAGVHDRKWLAMTCLRTLAYVLL